MDINQLIEIVKKKITSNLKVEDILIQDKTFLHKKHSSYVEGKFHLKLNIRSNYLNLKTRVEANKIIYKLLDQEIKKFIHSIEINLN